MRLMGSFLHADSKDSDQTWRMPRLICLRWAHTHFVGFVMSRLICGLQRKGLGCFFDDNWLVGCVEA